jgi:hypothetical protein
MSTSSETNALAYEYCAAPTSGSSNRPTSPRARGVETNWQKRLSEGLEDNQFQFHRQKILQLNSDVAMPGEYYEMLLRLISRSGELLTGAIHAPCPAPRSAGGH